MPCYDHKVTIQLLPDPLPALRDYHEPFSLICREGRQLVDRSKNSIRVSVDASGCKRVVVGVQPLEYIRKYDRTDKIRVTIDVDSRRAVTHYYTAEQIKWSEGELLTDGINLFQNEGVIDVLFEAICQDVKSQPSYRFQLLYTKDPQYDFVGSICKTGMFRANRVCMQKAIWLLQNDPYSGSHRQAAKEKLKREASESRMSKTERNPRAASESARTGKRKLEANERRHNGPERRFADDNDRKTKLIKENQDLEEEIMRLRLIKEQKKLRQELEELQNELDGGGPDRDNDRQDDRECFRGNDSRRGESSRDGGLLLTPPLTISSSTPSRDHLRDREQADRNSWYDNRTA